jgi:arginase
VAFDLVGVPYTSMARPGGIAGAIRALRAAGLAERVAARDAGDLDLPSPSGARGDSGLLNEAALGHLVATTREAVAGSLGRGRRPFLAGGDCPVLLGALAAGSDRFGAAGLLLVDGHEDTWPPQLSPTGEASDSEVAIALGRLDDLPAPLDALAPLLAPEALALLGPRDRAEIEEAGLASLDGTAALLLDDETVRARGAAAAAGAAIDTLAAAAPAFWLHVDLDVLRTADLPAVDHPQPGGLGWDELLAIGRRALAAPGCFGFSVVIYNPELHPDRTSAARIVRFASDLTATAGPSRSRPRRS